jgi:hypothetical protein
MTTKKQKLKKITQAFFLVGKRFDDLNEAIQEIENPVTDGLYNRKVIQVRQALEDIEDDFFREYGPRD